MSKHKESKKSQQVKLLRPSFHLFGPMCAGKTTIIERARENYPNIKVWDIKTDFYLKRKILKDGKVDWDMYNAFTQYIEEDIDKFFNTNKKHPIIIESSGLNKYINLAIKKYHLYPLYLKAPDEETIIKRADDRDGSHDIAVRIRTAYIAHMQKVQRYLPPPITSDEAVREIEKVLNMETTVEDLLNMIRNNNKR